MNKALVKEIEKNKLVSGFNIHQIEKTLNDIGIKTQQMSYHHDQI